MPLQASLAVGVTAAVEDVGPVLVQVVIFEAQGALQVVVQILKSWTIFSL
jgi:hypothetical protein